MREYLIFPVRRAKLPPSRQPVSPLAGGEQSVRAANSSCQWHDERSANAGSLRSSGVPGRMSGRTEGGSKGRTLRSVFVQGSAQ